VASSPTLPNSGDPGATLARARLNAGDLTTAERSGAAAAVCFPGLIPSVLFRSNGLDRGIPLRAHAPDALSRLSAPPVAAHPSWSDFSPLDLDQTVRTPRTPSDPSDPFPFDLDQTVRTPSDPGSHPFPLWRWARSVSALSSPLSLTLHVLPVSVRSPARVPSAADPISAVCF
jgi:hypothetical protein